MKGTLIKQATIVNEGKQRVADVLIHKNGRIEKIAEDIKAGFVDHLIDGRGLHLLPGVIDDQVHFREPGLTHKADLFTESRAAVAGGVTTFMDMPNTVPNALTQQLLQAKYDIAKERSLANYSFFMGASNDNLEEVLKTDPKTVCGIKIFMGSSTGNMLVDNSETLEAIFAQAPMLIAVHCEDEETIKNNLKIYEEKYGQNIPVECHPEIRSAAACFKSSYMAVKLAEKHNTRLHILHISTAEELQLFKNDLPLREKRITAEVCVHHLHFTADDYATLGTQIKCNPAIKSKEHREALWPALLDNRLDIIATDHAPHTWDEKQQDYKKAPSGVPLIQHSLQLMLEYAKEGRISLERVVEKMSHAPAECFRIKDRGYIREGYWADLVLVDLNKPHAVHKDNLQYKCHWSPFEGRVFSSSIAHTLVSGHLAYSLGHFDNKHTGMRVEFER